MTKRILLIDVDSKIPNLALMKLSTFFKTKGYEVDLHRCKLTFYSNIKTQSVVTIDADGYDEVYASIIFTSNKDSINIINCDNIDIGGSGYDLTKKLPDEIDDCIEDYSIYPDNDISYGFITRGCIRNCSFCFVPKKEGMIHRYRKIDEIVKHQKVIFMDNNILAHKDANLILQEIIDKKIKCQFNQGLDIRLINDTNAKLLSEIKYIGEYIFAFDNIQDIKLIESKLDIVKKYIHRPWKIKMFVYCHPDMDIIDNIIYRIEWCKRNKVLPYLMRDIVCYRTTNISFYAALAAWCNQPSFFKNLCFEEFVNRRTLSVNNKKRIIEVYKNGN